MNYPPRPNRDNHYQQQSQTDRRPSNIPYGRAQSQSYNQPYSRNSPNLSPQSNSYGAYSPQRYDSYTSGRPTSSSPPVYDQYHSNQYPYEANQYNQQQQRQSYNYNQQKYNNNHYQPRYQPKAQQHRDKSGDQEYMNSHLIDFHGRLSDYLQFAAPRRAILRLYTGAQNEDWLIHEIIDNFHLLIEFKPGIDFLISIYSKMTYKSVYFAGAVLKFYQKIVQTPGGYKLFGLIAKDVPIEQLAPIAQYYFDVFPFDHNPDYFDLLSEFIKIPHNNLNFSKLMNLDVYIQNPTASSIGSSILEYSPISLLTQFINEIMKNLNTLLEDRDLIKLICSVLIIGSKQQVDSIYRNIYPKVTMFLQHEFKWTVIDTLLTKLSMDQKKQLSDLICRNCQLYSAPHIDTLVCHSLERVNSKIRTDMIKLLEKANLNQLQYPQTFGFIQNSSILFNIM